MHSLEGERLGKILPQEVGENRLLGWFRYLVTSRLQWLEESLGRHDYINKGLRRNRLYHFFVKFI